MVKLVLPVLFSDTRREEQMVERCAAEFGPVDYRSGAFPFEFTSYYDDEMEGETFREFVTFGPLIRPEELVRAKHITNRLELEFASEGKRRVNLDPGYMELGKFVLATTKDQQHRLYIGEGIFEEVTLFYRDKGWRHWDWTYPDYRSDRYKAILENIRVRYKNQLKEPSQPENPL